jgi:hypothetical protein
METQSASGAGNLRCPVTKIGQGVSVASRAFPPQPAAAESGARSMRRIPMSGAPAQPSARHASEWAKVKEKEHLLEK